MSWNVILMLTSGQQLLGPGLEKTPDVKINNSLFLDDRDNKQAHAPHQFLTLQESRNRRLKRGELIPGERLLWVSNGEPCFEVFSKCYPAKRTRVWLGLKVMKTQRENMLGWTETSKKAPADSSRIDLFGLFFIFFFTRSCHAWIYDQNQNSPSNMVWNFALGTS